MLENHTIEKCYSLLNINRDSDWNDLRKSYRSLIHKWHPDKYKNENEKAIATETIKDLNTAYNQLSNYYNKHSTLPFSTLADPIPPPLHQTDNSELYPKEKLYTPQDKTVTASSKAQNSIYITRFQKFISYSIASIFIIVFYIYFDSFILSISTPIDSNKNLNTDYIDKAINKKPHVVSKTLEIKSSTTTYKGKQKNINPFKFFTYGSTIGEVVLVQGPPDKMDGDIWYYGKSEIHFKNGMVTKWHRTLKNPINAQVINIRSNVTKETKNSSFR